MLKIANTIRRFVLTMYLAVLVRSHRKHTKLLIFSLDLERASSIQPCFPHPGQIDHNPLPVVTNCPLFLVPLENKVHYADRGGKTGHFDSSDNQRVNAADKNLWSGGVLELSGTLLLW